MTDNFNLFCWCRARRTDIFTHILRFLGWKLWIVSKREKTIVIWLENDWLLYKLLLRALPVRNSPIYNSWWLFSLKGNWVSPSRFFLIVLAIWRVLIVTVKSLKLNFFSLRIRRRSSERNLRSPNKRWSPFCVTFHGRRCHI
jgi:hypothetical protein